MRCVGNHNGLAWSGASLAQAGGGGGGDIVDLMDSSRAVFKMSTTSLRSGDACFMSPDGLHTYGCDTGSRYIINRYKTGNYLIGGAKTSYNGDYDYDQFSGLYFHPDGDRFWTYNRGTHRRKHYKFLLSTPWDITTAVQNTSIKVFYPDHSVYGVWFNPAGTHLFACVQSTIQRADLGTPFGENTAVLNVGQVLDTSAVVSNPRSVCFNPEGTLLLADEYEFHLSTPWDLTTAVATGKAVPENGNDVFARCFSMDLEGKFLLSGKTYDANGGYGTAIYSRRATTLNGEYFVSSDIIAPEGS